MVPGLVHQSGMKTECRWKNYYKSLETETKGDKDGTSGVEGMKELPPIKKEAKILRHGKWSENQRGISTLQNRMREQVI
jgi:hypothetical protein